MLFIRYFNLFVSFLSDTCLIQKEEFHYKDTIEIILLLKRVIHTK